MSPRKTYLGCDKQMVIVQEFYGRLPLIVSLSDTDIHIFRKTDILRNRRSLVRSLKHFT